MDFTLTKEQQDIIKAAREFAAGEFPDRAQEFDRNESFDLDLWRKACELGFVGVFIDEEFDGAGYGFFEHCLIVEEFWAVDPGIGQAILSTTFGSGVGVRTTSRLLDINKDTVVKAFRWLKAKFSICVAFYTFICPHETLSRAMDRTFKPKSPAMAAKITNQLWSIKELLGYKVIVN